MREGWIAGSGETQSWELIWKTQRLRLQEIRRGKGSLGLGVWHLEPLVRECRETVVLGAVEKGLGSTGVWGRMSK